MTAEGRSGDGVRGGGDGGDAVWLVVWDAYADGVLIGGGEKKRK